MGTLRHWRGGKSRCKQGRKTGITWRQRLDSEEKPGNKKKKEGFCGRQNFEKSNCEKAEEVQEGSGGWTREKAQRKRWGLKGRAGKKGDRKRINSGGGIQ